MFVLLGTRLGIEVVNGLNLGLVGLDLGLHFEVVFLTWLVGLVPFWICWSWIGSVGLFCKTYFIFSTWLGLSGLRTSCWTYLSYLLVMIKDLTWILFRDSIWDLLFLTQYLALKFIWDLLAFKFIRSWFRSRLGTWFRNCWYFHETLLDLLGFIWDLLTFKSLETLSCRTEDGEQNDLKGTHPNTLRV